ncbi:MAG: hypothetical protein NTY46_13290 [Candidatus Sumerlaeota bacterium]|nr:hypothetical protein [Candidatus Sumerlaeota bacterium]
MSGITISDNRAYVADMGAGLRIIDITNPSSPAVLDDDPTTNPAVTGHRGQDGICCRVGWHNQHH